MRIAMLGPLEVRTDEGGLADVPGARLRGLLIALALRPGHAIPKASLVDWIWGEQPPADATNALQRLVSRLRKTLPDGVIEGQTDGYRLAVAPDDVDAVRFERLVLAAQAGPADAFGRVRLLREALELWRGAAMQDIGLQDSEAFDAAVVRLEGLRLTAAEERFDAEITLGRGAELVTELTDLVAAHPMRERLVGALMRALVAAGRENEALQVYQRTREALADALGVDPSPELSALHVALLRGELGRREQTRKTNLRAELTSFVGRGADVVAVRELIAEHRLTTLIGPGGSGKTRLAGETARTLLGDLPDIARSSFRRMPPEYVEANLSADSTRSKRSSSPLTTWPPERTRFRSAIIRRFSRPVSGSSTAANWPVTPMTERTSFVAVATSCPATRTVPASAFSNVVRMLTVVVLPAPFGPSMENTDPSATSKSMPSSTTLSPYALRSPVTAIADFVMPSTMPSGPVTRPPRP